MKESLSLDEKFISNIFAKYLKAKIILQNSATILQEEKEYYGQKVTNFNQLSDYHRHLQIVETILALLPKAEYICLVREFLSERKTNSSKINNNSANFWWKKYYSEAQYQKLKAKAISRFLYLFLI